MIPANNTQSVPAPVNFGRQINTLQVWRFKDKNKRLRVACSMGDFSLWVEGKVERELFRINLGVLKTIASRAERSIQRASRERFEKASDLAPLPDSTVRRIWALAAMDSEARFSYSARITPSSLGGWRKCLKMVATIMQARGVRIPWGSPEFLQWEVM